MIRTVRPKSLVVGMLDIEWGTQRHGHRKGVMQKQGFYWLGRVERRISKSGGVHAPSYGNLRKQEYRKKVNVMTVNSWLIEGFTSTCNSSRYSESSSSSSLSALSSHSLNFSADLRTLLLTFKSTYFLLALAHHTLSTSSEMRSFS